MQIISTVDPGSWQPPQITCSKCGTIFRAKLDEFTKTFDYPRHYDYGSYGTGPAWLPYKFNLLKIQCPTCNRYHGITDIPLPVTELWLSKEKKRAQAHYDAHPEEHRYYE